MRIVFPCGCERTINLRSAPDKMCVNHYRKFLEADLSDVLLPDWFEANVVNGGEK